MDHPVLLVIVPSRARPEAIPPLVAAFAETCTATTCLVVAIDEDDPERERYAEAVQESPGPVSLWINQGEKSMVAALNGAVAEFTVNPDHPYAVAFMGDDHRPRTKGWDTAYIQALRELGTGIVYGNDLLQGENIPTQVAMTADIPRALGHMAPPCLTHLFVDNYWRDLGRAAGCIRYLPDVVVEHVHPFAGKAAMDEGYARVNDHGMYSRDAAAYAEYAARRLVDDVTAVRALR
jgi:hypothetical protein